MKLRPLHDRVVVRRKDKEETTAGGIVLPGSAKEKPSQGEVVAVGTGRILDNGDVRPLAVKVGDVVIFEEYAATAHKIQGEDLLVVKESNIIGVIES